MADILEVATSEFANKGLSGARIDEIAAATRTSKRMIYYYFGSKEGLYIAVLEDAYRRMRAIESDLHLEDLPPEDALRRLVGFTFDHHDGNPDLHPAGDDREHGARRLPGAKQKHPGAQRAGHPGHPPAVRPRRGAKARSAPGWTRWTSTRRSRR